MNESAYVNKSSADHNQSQMSKTTAEFGARDPYSNMNKTQSQLYTNVITNDQTTRKDGVKSKYI